MLETLACLKIFETTQAVSIAGLPAVVDIICFLFQFFHLNSRAPETEMFYDFAHRHSLLSAAAAALSFCIMILPITCILCFLL